MGGKKKGKLFASILGFALGAGSPEFFGLKAAEGFTAGMYGMSLASNLWSMTNKPKVDYGRFDNLMNTVSSEAMIPIIYGTRKWAGNQVFHNSTLDGEQLTKHVVIGEGEIDSVSGICANDLLVENGAVFSIKNILYSDATVNVYYDTSGKTANDKMMVLHANGVDKFIPLQRSNDLKSDNSNEHSCFIAKLCNYITNLHEGWIIENVIGTSNAPEEIQDLDITNCYNSPVSLTVKGLPSCDVFFYDNVPPANYESTGGYKNLAYIIAKLKISSKLQGGNPTISYICKGKKVNVYRDGAWHYEWSDNPVWCVRDYCLSRRYGLGRWITADMLDNDAWLESADYCDELVTYKDENGITRQEKRYTLNIILDQKKDAVEQLSDMLCNFAGYFSFTPYSIALRIEKATPKSYGFTDATIIADSVKWKVKPASETYNRYTVGYVDPVNNWTQVKVLLEDFPSQKESGKIRNSDATYPGVTSQSQALRLTRLLKDSMKMCPVNMSFQTTTMAMHLVPGDVIHITYKNIFAGMPYRIQQIEENNGIWTITCRQYNESIYNDSLGAEIQIKDYKIIASPITDNVPDVTNLILSQTYYRQGDGTIVSDIGIGFDATNYQFLRQYLIDYSIDGGTTWTATTPTLDNKIVLHNAIVKATYLIRARVQNTVGRISDGIVSLPLLITGKDNPPSNVASITATQDPTDATKVKVSWTPVTDVDLKCYDLTINGIIQNPNPTTFFDHIVAASGTYTYSVTARDWSDNPSDAPAVKMVAVNVEPSTIQGFQALQNGANVLLSWQKPTEPDVVGVEIREGAVFANGSLITTGFTETMFNVPVSTEVKKRYHIKAINRAGKYSKFAATYEVTISNLPPQNVILEYDEIALQNGTHTGTTFGQSYYTFLTLPGKFSDYAGVKFSDIGGLSVLKLQDGFTEGNYLVQRKDLGEILSVNISAEFKSSVLLGNGMSAKLQFRTSLNGTTWDAWRDFQSIQMTTRYIDYQIVMSRTGAMSPEVNTLTEKIDVPDTMKRGVATVAVGGTTINYGFTFRNTDGNPVVTPTAIGAGLRAELVSVGQSSFVVKVLNLSNVDVGGQVSWTAIGY